MVASPTPCCLLSDLSGGGGGRLFATNFLAPSDNPNAADFPP